MQMPGECPKNNLSHSARTPCDKSSVLRAKNGKWTVICSKWMNVLEVKQGFPEKSRWASSGICFGNYLRAVNVHLSHGFYSSIISLRYQCPSAAAFRGPSTSLGCSLFCFRLPRLLLRSVFGRFSGPCFRESSAKGPRRLPPRLVRTPFLVDFVWLVKVNLISDVGLLYRIIQE